MNELVDFAKIIGLPATLAGVGLVGWLLFTRRLITKSENDADIAACKLALEQEQARTEQMRKERDQWKELCLGLLQNVERAGNASSRVMQAVAEATVVKKPNGDV